MRHKLLLATAALSLAACERTSTSPMVDHAGQPAFERSDVSAQAVGAAVYTLSNNANNNQVIAYDRSAATGLLTPAGTFPTGGQGTGAGLGSQGALVLSSDGLRLYAVNAGSNEISSFRVTSAGLVNVARVPSGGTTPISIALYQGLLYVLNGGGAGNITGFHAAADGSLSPIPNSTRPLSTSAAGPAQVGITPNGAAIVVTEKNTKRISVYRLGSNGTPEAGVVNASSGQTPFGFTFDRTGLLIVSEAFGGTPNASRASSYLVNPNGTLTVVTASIPTFQTAACWFAVSSNGRFAYATNTGSASVTGFSIHSGTLGLVDASGNTGATHGTPTDAAFAYQNKYFYVLAASGSIDAYRPDETSGALTPLGSASGLPHGTVGLAVR